MSLVRLYGNFVGNSSAANVTAGWKEALLEHGILADAISLNNPAMPDRRAETDGTDAPVALVTDLREVLGAVSGNHREVHVVLAMHTRWIPPLIAHLLWPSNTTVLSPSTYSMLLAQKALNQGVKHMVVEHGVNAGFRPLTDVDRGRLEETPLYERLRRVTYGNFLHTCESSVERKGTIVLMKAFEEFCARGEADASLTIVVSSQDLPRIKCEAAELSCKDKIHVIPRMNAAPEKMRWVYGCFDFIVQPSRAEGFGLVPLEGLVCGTPCIVTTDCGHEAWAYGPNGEVRPGICRVRTREPSPAMFEPSEAPTVQASDVCSSLIMSYIHGKGLREAARADAPTWRESWKWGKVTAEWAKEIKERYA